MGRGSGAVALSCSNPVIGKTFSNILSVPVICCLEKTKIKWKHGLGMANKEKYLMRIENVGRIWILIIKRIPANLECRSHPGGRRLQQRGHRRRRRVRQFSSYLCQPIPWPKRKNLASLSLSCARAHSNTHSHSLGKMRALSILCPFLGRLERNEVGLTRTASCTGWSRFILATLLSLFLSFSVCLCLSLSLSLPHSHSLSLLSFPFSHCLSHPIFLPAQVSLSRSSLSFSPSFPSLPFHSPLSLSFSPSFSIPATVRSKKFLQDFEYFWVARDSLETLREERKGHMVVQTERENFYRE